VQIVGELGAGVKVKLSNHFGLRVQVRDYLSPKPSEVIAPGPGADHQRTPERYYRHRGARLHLVACGA